MKSRNLDKRAVMGRMFVELRLKEWEVEDIGDTGMWNLRSGRRRTMRKAIRNEQRKK